MLCLGFIFFVSFPDQPEWSGNMMLLLHVCLQPLRALPALTVPAWPPGAPPTLLTAQDPMSAPRPVSSSPQPYPAWPWAPPSWAHPQARVLAQPLPSPVTREAPNARGWGCPGAPRLPCFWLGQWDGPGCQALPCCLVHGEPPLLLAPEPREPMAPTVP